MTHRCLHHHKSRYTLCSATALHRHLYLHGSNGSMRVALRYKCQLYLVVASTVMKRRSDEHSKTPSWYINTKVYSLLHILVVVVKRETEYELSRPL